MISQNLKKALQEEEKTLIAELDRVRKWLAQYNVEKAVINTTSIGIPAKTREPKSLKKTLKVRIIEAINQSGESGITTNEIAETIFADGYRSDMKTLKASVGPVVSRLRKANKIKEMNINRSHFECKRYKIQDTSGKKIIEVHGKAEK